MSKKQRYGECIYFRLCKWFSELCSGIMLGSTYLLITSIDKHTLMVIPFLVEGLAYYNEAESEAIETSKLLVWHQWQHDRRRGLKLNSRQWDKMKITTYIIGWTSGWRGLRVTEMLQKTQLESITSPLEFHNSILHVSFLMHRRGRSWN